MLPGITPRAMMLVLVMVFILVTPITDRVLGLNTFLAIFSQVISGVIVYVV